MLAHEAVCVDVHLLSPLSDHRKQRLNHGGTAFNDDSVRRAD